MVDQAQLLEAVILRCRDGVDIEIKGEDACQTPLLNGSLDLGRPHQIRRPVGAGLLDGNVVVRTSDLVLGAVLALREALVTSDVPLLASFAALARLGVATEMKSVRRISQVDTVRLQTYLRRGGPPPGPAIVPRRWGMDDWCLLCRVSVKIIDYTAQRRYERGISEVQLTVLRNHTQLCGPWARACKITEIETSDGLGIVKRTATLESGRAARRLQMRACGKVEPQKLQRDRTFGRQAVKAVARGFLLKSYSRSLTS